MGLGAARIGDATIGNCSTGGHNSDPYSGIIISGSADVFSEGLGNAFVTSTVRATCGDIGLIVSGSSSVFANGLGAGTITSVFSGTYSGQVIGGAGSVFVG